MVENTIAENLNFVENSNSTRGSTDTGFFGVCCCVDSQVNTRGGALFSKFIRLKSVTLQQKEKLQNTYGQILLAGSSM